MNEDKFLVEQAEVSVNLANRMRNIGILDWRQVVNEGWTPAKFLKIQGIGRRTLEELHWVLGTVNIYQKGTPRNSRAIFDSNAGYEIRIESPNYDEPPMLRECPICGKTPETKIVGPGKHAVFVIYCHGMRVSGRQWDRAIVAWNAAAHPRWSQKDED